ncbi:unnamed protein product, partial [Nesidiocoris tenuis]
MTINPLPRDGNGFKRWQIELELFGPRRTSVRNTRKSTASKTEYYYAGRFNHRAFNASNGQSLEGVQGYFVTRFSKNAHADGVFCMKNKPAPNCNITSSRSDSKARKSLVGSTR